MSRLPQRMAYVPDSELKKQPKKETKTYKLEELKAYMDSCKKIKIEYFDNYTYSFPHYPEATGRSLELIGRVETVGDGWILIFYDYTGYDKELFKSSNIPSECGTKRINIKSIKEITEWI